MLIEMAVDQGIEVKSSWTKSRILEAISQEMHQRAEAEAARPQTKLEELRVELNELKAGVATKREKLGELMIKLMP